MVSDWAELRCRDFHKIEWTKNRITQIKIIKSSKKENSNSLNKMENKNR